ncbi:DUF6230 family protein [Virgibacillus doumboii]|uniref:DUF6230 family protein n=1 Tax=Virgibacillus doumboii TaxID=2697503 RepID=UPI0013DF4A69|nr:DUF6230 family protein [Virgibacillus doumboii]
MDNRDKVAVGKTWKKKFFIAFFAGFLALGGLMSVFGFTGTAVALPMGGIGDFYVKFDKLEGKGFQLLPHIGETGNSDAEPMIRNKIDEVTITNLHIYKDMKMPGGQWVRIHIKASGPTKISGLIQDARMIDANLSFNELAIEERNTTDFSKNWSQQAKTITITDAKLVTDYLFQNVVSLEGTKIYVEKIDSPDMTKQPGSSK